MQTVYRQIKQIKSENPFIEFDRCHIRTAENELKCFFWNAKHWREGVKKYKKSSEFLENTKLNIMTSLLYKKFKIIFTLKRGLKGNLYAYKRIFNRRPFLVQSFHFSISWWLGKTRTIQRVNISGGVGWSVLRRNLHNFTI